MEPDAALREEWLDRLENDIRAYELQNKTAPIQTKEPEKTECELKTELFMGRKVFILKAKNQNKSSKKILYFHGGSYVAEATQDHWDFMEQIVKDTGATIIMPDYPLTPKYTYKDVFAMVEPLYKEIINQIKKS